MEKEKVIKITDSFKERDKAQIEKFATSISLADDRTWDILGKYGVSINRCSQLKVLTIDPKTITQTLELAEKMGFLDAYKTNPARLSQMVTNVIKRMAKCDANGISYKTEREDGQVVFADFIFSERKFKQKMAELNLGGTPKDQSLEEIEESQIDINHVKKSASKLLEIFGMAEEFDSVSAGIDELASSGLSEKEILMRVFSAFGGNRDLLSDKVDEVLGLNVVLGRAA